MKLLLSIVVSILALGACTTQQSFESKVPTFGGAKCSTDTECMEMFGGDGGPGPREE